jgi:ABC-type Mn2+/Zn2+ transport system permease subunit
MAQHLFISIATGISISALSAYLGSLMLSNRMVLTAGPLGHLTLPGVALALLYGFDVSLGAFPFVVLGALLIWALEIKTKLPLEALTAIIFSFGVAVTFLFLPIEQAETALIGDISKVAFNEMVISVVVSIIFFLLIKLIYSKITLINISEDLALSRGINVRKYKLIYLFSIAVVVSLGVKLVGGLLTAALVAIPPSAARNISSNLKSYISFSVLFAVISAVSGIFLYKATTLPPGPLVIVVSALIFLITAFFRKSA